MNTLTILRELLASSGTVETTESSSNVFPAHELRYVLEYPQKPNVDVERKRVEALLESSLFQLVELDANLENYLVLRFTTLERTLLPRDLFAIGYTLADNLGLVSAEPELGSDFFADPEEPDGQRGLEAADVLGGLCWVKGQAPEDRLWALKKTAILTAWEKSRGHDIIIAQPDTGVADHDQLDPQRLDRERAFDIIDGDKNPSDPLTPGTANPGHGTGTASVLAGKETAQMSGAAPDSLLVPIRCIEDVKVFNAAPVAAAIAYATRVGCHIISMSLGGVPSQALYAAVRQAVAEDLIVIAASGNCVRTVVWPARYREVIAVAGSNNADQPWKGSSRGEAIDICAPAEFVWRAQRNSKLAPLTVVSGGQGTSFATALVAGIAALWLAHHGRGSVVAEAHRRGVTVQHLFKTALQATASPPDYWDDENFGPGIANAARLLEMSLSEIPDFHAEAAQLPAQSMQNFLNETFGPAPSDSQFPWSRYEAEIAMIALSQAKFTGVPQSLCTEAKTQKTRPSPQLNEAALKSADPRLMKFAERQGATSISRPSSSHPNAKFDARMQIALPAKKLGLENKAGGLDSHKARTYLAGQGKKEQMDRLTKMIDAEKPIALQVRNEVIGAAEQAIDQFVQGQRLDPKALLGLEALVRLTGRPALRVRNNYVDWEDPCAGEWGDRIFLAQQNNSLQARMGSVGRIDVEGVHIGTGFVVGAGMVLTNRHVLQAFAVPVPRRNRPDRWLLSHTDVSIDFADEPSSLTTATRFRIKSVIAAGPDEIREDLIDFACLDAALLEVETVNDYSGSLPAAMELVRNQGMAAPRKEIYLVGYPGRPITLPRNLSGNIDIEIASRLNELFGADYGTKYLAPGEIIQAAGQIQQDPMKWVITHDATTMGGCSGSFLINLDDPMGVVGLHFGGYWLRENYAHSMGAIAAGSNFIAGVSVNWK